MVDSYTEEEIRAFMASRIQAAIDEQTLKGENLAEAMGVSKAAISKWSKEGKITHANLYRLSRLTSKPIAWFYPGYVSAEESAGARIIVESAAGDSEVLEQMLLDVLNARKRASQSE